MKNKISIAAVQLIIIFLAVGLGALYFLQIEIDADMAGSIIVPYMEDKYKGDVATGQCSIWGLVQQLSYYIWGISEAGVKFIFSVFYGITCLLVFELCYDKEREISVSLFPLAFFLLIPGVSATKTHMVPTVLALLLLLYLQKGKEFTRKIQFLFWIFYLLMIYSTADTLLLFLWIGVPLLLYGIYRLVVNPKFSKYLFWGIAAGVFLIFVYYILFSMGQLSFLNKIYGVSDYYLSWASLPKIWDKGIEFLLQAVVHAMNIDVRGALIQPMSAIWISKIAMLTIGLCNLVHYTKVCFKGNNDWDKIIICGSIYLSAVMFLCNGQRITLYENYGYFYSYSGYMGIVWPLLVVLAIDFLKVVSERREKKYMQLIYVAGGVCFSLIMVMEAGRFHKSEYKNVDQQTAEYLVERGNEAGLAIYNAHPVMAWSEGKFFSMPYVNITEEGKWGYRQYDTVLEYLSESAVVQDEEIINLDKAILSAYGEYDESAYFFEDVSRPAFSDTAEGRAIYSFDRDIRWPVRVYELVEYKSGTPVSVELPLGENRISIQGSYLDNTEIIFLTEAGNELPSRCITREEEACAYVVCAPADMVVDVIIQSRDNGMSAIYNSLKIEMIRAAICIKEETTISVNEKIQLNTDVKKGTYIFVLNGMNLGQIALTMDKANEAVMVQDGSERKIYQVNVTTDEPTVFIQNMGKHDIILNSIYYELTIPDREAVIEKLSSE